MVWIGVNVIMGRMDDLFDDDHESHNINVPLAMRLLHARLGLRTESWAAAAGGRS